MKRREEYDVTESFGVPKVDKTIADAAAPEAETTGAVRKIAILPPPVRQQREARPITNLGKVFGQFAELQQQIAEQVVALEESVHHQKQDLATAMEELPELRERINWLIASFYEQSKKDESVRDRLNGHDAALATLADTVKAVQETQRHWQTAFDEMIASLLRAKAAMGGK